MLGLLLGNLGELLGNPEMNQELCYLLEEGSRVSFSRSAGTELGRRISNAGGGEGGPPSVLGGPPPLIQWGLEGLLKGGGGPGNKMSAPGGGSGDPRGGGGDHLGVI